MRMDRKGSPFRKGPDQDGREKNRAWPHWTVDHPHSIARVIVASPIAAPQAGEAARAKIEADCGGKLSSILDDAGSRDIGRLRDRDPFSQYISTIMRESRTGKIGNNDRTAGGLLLINNRRISC